MARFASSAPILLGFALAACGGSDDVTNDDATGTTSAGTGASPGVGGSGGSAVGPGPGSGGAGNATSVGGAGGTGGGGTGGGGGGAAEVVRFIAMGDGGEGNGTQLQVAQAIKAECDARGGCMFALYLGDNIYDTGVDSAMDEQFQTKFEIPYSELNFPFYISLGNHDYGGGGIGYEFYKGAYQVDYTQYSTKWHLPSHYYTESISVPGTTVDVFALDTNAIMYTGAPEQQTWVTQAIASSTATWKLAFGHHTYVSNGQHGNAGTYEGIPGIPIVSGGNVQDFMNGAICGQVDAYLCGHDHNRQWLQPTCGTEFIVSGTAAKTTDLSPKGTPTFFENDELGGFFLGEIAGNTFTGWFYDENGNMEFTRTVTK